MTVRECIKYYQENICTSKSSTDRYDALIRKFPELIEIELADLQPSDIVKALRAETNLQDSTKHLYYVSLKSAIYRAIKDHTLKIQIDLAGLFKNKTSNNGVVKYLLLDDVKKLLSYPIPNNKPTKKRARDLFILMCLSGMAISDAEKFNPATQVTTDPNGKQWFEYRRTKNGNPCQIPVTDDAKEIIERYNGSWPLGKLIGSRRTFHNHCIWIGEVLGKHVSSHTARHTMGCIFLEFGFSLESVSNFLGHTNTVITGRVYAQVTKQKIEREMDRIDKSVMSLKVR